MDMRKTYPSDITRKQFKNIQPLLESIRKKTRPRELDLYDLFCGVLYVLKSGCQWRMVPSDFPKWRSVYPYFQLWSEQREGEKSILEQALLERTVPSMGGKRKQASVSLMHKA